MENRIMPRTITLEQLSEDYTRIAQAIEYIENNHREQPDLKKIASSVYLSEYHFQRLFTRWVGVSPKRFLQFLTVQNAKRLLRESKSLLETAYASGLSGTGRLHDLFLSAEAVTPGTFKNRGAGLLITYGEHPSPFGRCLLSVTDRGICGLSFVDDERRDHALFDLPLMYPAADFRKDADATRPIVEKIFSGERNTPGPPLRLFAMGTNFQLKIWEALLHIPEGAAVTYEQIARSIGIPGAARAVGNAVALNPISYLIPCHRVIRNSGIIGKYQWGTTRKKLLLAYESAHVV